MFARRLPPSATACAPASSYYAPAESLRGRSPDSSESAFPERIGGRSASISKELGAGATRVPYRTRSCNASSSWQTTLCLAASAGARAAWSPKSASPPTPSHASGAAKVREPNLSREFKISRHQRFDKEFRDVTGPRIHSPEHSLALCRDENTQSVGPVGGGSQRAPIHKSIRHGTIILLAALHRLAGKLIRGNEDKLRHPERLRCLKQIDQEPP